MFWGGLTECEYIAISESMDCYRSFSRDCGQPMALIPDPITQYSRINPLFRYIVWVEC